MDQVLVVAADRQNNGQLVKAVQAAGYACAAASTMAEAHAVAASERMRAVLVDCTSKQWSPVDLRKFFESLRKAVDALLILALPRNASEYQETLFYVDDFITLPCKPWELQVRLKRAFSRNSRSSARTGEIKEGPLVIDLGERTASINARPIRLAQREFDLLACLAGHPGALYTRQQLVNAVWGPAFTGGQRTVDVYILRLRRQLGTLEGLIETVRHRGYRFHPVAPHLQAVDAS